MRTGIRSADPTPALSCRPEKKLSGPRLLEALPTLLAAVAGHASAASTAHAIADEVVVELGVRSVAVYLADLDERTLRRVSAHNTTEVASLIRLDDHNVLDPAARAARTRLLFLASEAPSTVDETSLALPLLAGGRLLGAITCTFAVRLEPRDFRTLDALGVVLGAILDRARREEEERARSAWVSLVAHELRQPLNSMLLHARLLESGDGGDARESAGRIADRVKRMNRLLRDLTDASLFDLGHLALQRETTDLVALVEGMTRNEEIDGGRHLRVDVRGEIPPMYVDPCRIEQILSNLLSNAEKYSRPGSVIELSIERRGEDVAVSVMSEGETIPEPDQRRLFERFYRAHADSKRGLGIGLHVCCGLAEAHGGSVSVSSVDGRTVFDVVLPLSVPAPATSTRASRLGSLRLAKAAPVGDRHRRCSTNGEALVRRNAQKILVVDKDDNTRSALARMLGDEGHEVAVCADAVSALERLDVSVFDVMFADQTLLGMSGLELAKAARRRQQHLRCIVASGYKAPALRDRADTEWLTKPIDIDELLQLLAQRRSRPVEIPMARTAGTSFELDSSR